MMRTLFLCAILLTTQQSSFEVATIKQQQPETLHYAGGGCHGVDTHYQNTAQAPPLGRCVITFTLASLFAFAYSPTAPPGGIWKTSGGPAWVDSDWWLVEGKAENPDTVKEGELKQMLQTLLADRFKLQFHHEQRQGQGYALVVAKSGLKISEDKGERAENERTMSAGPNGLTYRKAPLSMFVNYLSGPAGAPVIDKTGLDGAYSFSFQPPRPQPVGADPTLNDAPSIFTAIQEQLGLRLEPIKIPIDMIVIDHAERPTPN